MLKLLRLVLLLVCFSLFNITTHAQTKDVGHPISWKNKLAKSTPAFTLPNVDLSRNLQEDAINDVTKNAPWRFGYTHHTYLTLQNSGVWENLPNGDRVWRLKINSPAAISLNMLLADFQLSPGAALHLYNEDRTELQGAYTSDNNNQDKVLGTMPIKGNTLWIELYEPANGNSQFTIEKVIQGYRSIFNYAEEIYTKELEQSGNCNYDIKCPLGNGWEEQASAVAIIVINGAGACTGTLINNTSQDGTPYFLTANHCTSNSNVANWVFRFNWDSPVAICATNGRSQAPAAGTFPIVNGSTLVASRSASDFALLRLNSIPTGDIYYAGWDRSGNVPTGSVTGIHHPAGDVKKISIENDAIRQEVSYNTQSWRVSNWDNGTTEGGSSGSALFDSNKRIIGQLYGGTAGCSGLSNNGQPDFYGRLDVSWSAGSAANQRLKEWLDPNNTNANTLDGYNPNTPTESYDIAIRTISGVELYYCNQDSITPIVTFRNHGTETLTNLTITYGIQGNNSTYNWTGNLTTGATTSITLPSIAVINGNNVLSTNITIPNITENNTNNNSNTFAFTVVNGGETVNVHMLTDCYGSEISWEIKNTATNTVVYAKGPYEDVGNPVMDITSLCLPIGCYTFRVIDSYGDGINSSGYCRYAGNFFIRSSIGDTLVRMTTPNIGAGASFNFCVTTPTAPIASFTANRTNLCQGNSVNFTSTSTGATQYTWTFDGGTPNTSTLSNPIITYNTPGTYNVKLVVTNPLGNNEIIQNGYITVAANTLQTTIEATQNTLSALVQGGTAPYYYRWNNNITTSSITARASGNYTVSVTDANGCVQSTSLYHTLVSVSEIGLVEFEARLYPNPTSHKTTLELINIAAEEVAISLYNIAGQRLMQEHFSTTIGDSIQKDFDIADLPSGIYMIQVATNNGAQTFKLIKQ